VEDGSNTCRGAFSSTKDRFASTAAYRSSTFASVVKEPYADPEAVGPGTYRAPRRAIHVKKQQVPTPSYVSKAARFEEANAQVTAVLALASPTANSPNEREYSLDSSPRGAGGGGRSSPDRVRGPVLSTTPRFKSDVFPGAVNHHCTTPISPTETNVRGTMLANRALRILKAASSAGRCP
jgi:hypothetical protein